MSELWCPLHEPPGIGIAPGATEAAGHFGLLTARHRVAAAGGRLEIITTSGRATSIEVAMPTSN